MFWRILFLVILFISFLWGTSIVFAQKEIQIEGKDGMAEKLPCWKIKNKWTKLIVGSNPLTGYHFYTWLFLFLFAQLSFFLDITKFSLGKECKICGFVLLLTVLADFLWFVLNPHFGIEKFKKSNIKWHKTWFCRVPLFYWPLSIIGITLLCLGYFCIR